MDEVIGVVVAAVVAFVLSGAWYAALGGRLAELNPAAYADAATSPVVVAVELARSAVVATGTLVLLRLADVDAVLPALGVGLLLWAAFPAVILLGSVVHEKVPAALAAIHAGDWLFKLPAIAAVVTLV